MREKLSYLSECLMKKKKSFFKLVYKKLLFFIFILSMVVSTSKPVISNAAVNVNLNPHYVSDIDNILYPATSQYHVFDGLQGVGSFNIVKPTIIKAYFNWDITTSKRVTGNAWISRDQNGLDVVGSAMKLTKAGDSLLVFLDPGTYYINHVFSVKNSTDSSFIKVGVALLAEDADSDERVYASSYKNPNVLSLGTPVRGFLSTISPVDYYNFTLKEKSMVTISYNFEQTDNVRVNGGLCTLLNKSNQKLISKTFSMSGADSNKISQILNKGTYYVSLAGATAATSLNVDAISYAIKPVYNDEDWTRKNIRVKIPTEFEATEILCVAGKVAKTKINDRTIWNKRLDSCFEVENNIFTATKRGYYTIRTRDEKNNFEIKTFYVGSIDKGKPYVRGVSNNKTYKRGTVVTFDDALSGVAKATLNGKRFVSGKKVTTRGKNTLKIYDSVGNVRKVVFFIK